MGMARLSASALTWILLFLLLPQAHGGILRANKVLLLCHRTANQDLPENTLESLAFAAHMGCDIVEVDVRRTLDGQLVLNHDGLLDRFTDTTGEVESTDLRELDRIDFGSWMGERFSGMHIPHFDEALRLARELKIGLYLDIKTKGLGPQILAAVRQEGMTDQVRYGGEWDDVHQLDPQANEDPSAGLQPGFKREDLDALHKQHKIVIADFILNGHEFDLDGMKQAVAFGVDGIMVDYPRLGAEAVGRPVEKKIATLTQAADSGTQQQRVDAIRELSNFVGLPLQPQFFRWLGDSDEQVSHEAALALVTSRPRPTLASFEAMTHSSSSSARSSAAWAIGALARDTEDGTQCGRLLAPLLHDANTSVLTQTLVGLSRCPSDPQVVSADLLTQILHGDVPVLRGLAAVALATHHPEIAEPEVAAQLEKVVKAADTYNAAWTANGRPKLSQTDLDKLVEGYREQMKEVKALAMLPGGAALAALADQAFRPGHDYSMGPILLSGFRLWDHLGDDPTPALQALSAQDHGEADWAEWALVKAGPKVLPAVRQQLPTSQGDVRRRLIQILAWQADKDALPMLRSIGKTDATDQELIRWAIATIQPFQPGS
jgi:glycerophosphoryl diester phosphodiesterase